MRRSAMSWTGVPMFLLGLAGHAAAHPHVMVESRSQIIVAGGQITEVRHVWTFDEAFSAYAIQGLDTNGDGQLTREELQPLAQTNVESLNEYDFFTYLSLAGIDQEGQQFKEPVDYWLDWDGLKLTLHFTLPLSNPVPVDGEAVRFEVYDPEYFVAFALAEKDPVTMTGAPGNCAVGIERPKELDTAVRQELAQIPADVRELPEELYSVTAALTNAITVSCR